MKIISLTASNFKKITAVEITPAGNVVTLTGLNGAGKSSILDAIQSTLAGGKTIPDEPIRRGEERGVVTLLLDSGLKVTRTFTPSGGSLRVENAEGHTQRSPQAILDALLGNLAFDPLAFSRLKSHEQWEQLRELIGLDFKKLDADRQKAYDDRTVVGRELLRQQVLLKDIPPTVDDAPDAETKTAAVLAELEAASVRNREIQLLKDRIGITQAAWQATQVKVEEAEEEIRAIEEALSNWKKELEERKTTRKAAMVAKEVAITAASGNTMIDLEPIKEKLKSLEADNARVREKQKRRDLVAGVKKSDGEQEAFTRQINEIDATKTKMIADATFPLSELSFDGAQITYHGIPFAQTSDGEKLRVSVAVGMALNPKLRVIFVRDGSLLDKSGLQTIADLAAANEYQCWVEDSRSTDPSAIEIVDGAIKI